MCCICLNLKCLSAPIKHTKTGKGNLRGSFCGGINKKKVELKMEEKGGLREFIRSLKGWRDEEE